MSKFMNFFRSLFGLKSKRMEVFVTVKLTSELFTQFPDAAIHGYLSVIRKPKTGQKIDNGYPHYQFNGELAKDVRDKICNLGYHETEESYTIDFTNMKLVDSSLPDDDETNNSITKWHLEPVSGDSHGLTTAYANKGGARTNYFELNGNFQTSWIITQ